MKNKYLSLLAASSFAFFMQACGDDSSSASSDDADDGVVGTTFVVGSDYTTGEIRWIENGKVSEKSLKIHQDTKLVSVGSDIFALERSGADNVVLLNPEKKEVIWQASLDDYSNPTDIVAAGKSEAWVALEGADSLVKISMNDGKVTKSVKTTDFISKGGFSPNLADLEVSGDTLFAIFQRYVSNYDDKGTWIGTTYPKGLLAMYSVDEGKLLDTIQLAGINPSAVAVVDGNVYVSTMGDYATTKDCGLEKVDLSKKTSSMVIAAEKLGGGLYGRLALDYKNGVAYAAVYKAWGDVPVAKIDLDKASFEMVKGIADAEGDLHFDAATKTLYVGDRSMGAEALYAYDGAAVTKVEVSSDKTLPPYSIAVGK